MAGGNFVMMVKFGLSQGYCDDSAAEYNWRICIDNVACNTIALILSIVLLGTDLAQLWNSEVSTNFMSTKKNVHK